jgi:formylmethanofuran dehydrogenase subunit A
MVIRIFGGRIVDPANGRDEIGDLWIQEDRIIAPPEAGKSADAPAQEFDASGMVVLAGGIDIHSHIAGTNVNTARLLLPEHAAGGTSPVPVGELIGRLYAAMGFSLVVEPAISPHVALQAQCELAGIPFIDKAILSALGNDDFCLRLVRAGEETALVDYIGRTLSATRGLGVKTINPGGAAAFREHATAFSLDDEVPRYGVSSRAIMKALQRATKTLGVPHPLHLHCNNLGLPGNVETALATIAAAEGERLHLAHLQFYAYGKEGPRQFSSAAARLAEAVNAAPNITADVGQVMFGQTVTISLDTIRQFNALGAAHPRKFAIIEAEGQGGGIVPYKYRRTNFYNVVQWAAGLELFLLIRDPWRVFFTTDHPNGAPFTAYPDLFALLMDRDLRAQWIAELPKDAMEMTTLPAITREYDWPEIAVMTRAAPARLLGLADRGHLGPGARADIAIYRPGPDKAAMFRNAALVFKDGVLIMRDGVPLRSHFGKALYAKTVFDPAIVRRLAAYYETSFGVSHEAFDVVPEALEALALRSSPPARSGGARETPNPFEEVPCLG